MKPKGSIIMSSDLSQCFFFLSKQLETKLIKHYAIQLYVIFTSYVLHDKLTPWLMKPGGSLKTRVQIYVSVFVLSKELETKWIEINQ